MLFSPRSRDDLVQGVKAFAAASVPLSFFGGGTNLLVSDKGIRGVVIQTTQLTDICHEIKGSTVYVRAEAGVLMSDLVQWCVNRGFAGLETFAGLPGTVGGAVYMNARCYEKSISDVFYTAEVMTFSKKRCILGNREYRAEDWGYKRSPFQESCLSDSTILTENRMLVLATVFVLSLGSVASLHETAQKCLTDRKKKQQFEFPSAGSMFKNNRAFGKPSGKVIDEHGLCGMEYGRAQIAPWHGNFFINKGEATAKDVRHLVEEVQKKIYCTTSIMLEPEVIFCGDWDTA